MRVGDELLVDGGMVRFEVTEKIGPDVKCKCTDPGLLLPRANLTFWREGRLVRERNAMLPTISSKVSEGNLLRWYFFLCTIECFGFCMWITLKRLLVGLFLFFFCAAGLD